MEGNKGLRILVTNDDGVTAPGIAAVATTLIDAGHEVTVAAPDRNFSGCGTSLGPVGEGATIRFNRLTDTGFAGAAEVLSIGAPPAAIVLAMVQGSPDGWRPDWVISGINNGFNTGRAALHSGTLSAALTAGSLGIPAIAVSAGVAARMGLALAGGFVARLIGHLGQETREPVVLNINVPETSEPRGVTLAASQGTSVTDLEYSRSEDHWVVRKVGSLDGFEAESEGAALMGEQISISSPSPDTGPAALARIHGFAMAALDGINSAQAPGVPAR
jgi:5'-nucleotidase